MENLAEHLEHTYLKTDITDKTVEKLVEEAEKYRFIGLCLPPFWIKKARRELSNDTTTQLVTVIGFPLGYQRTEVKIAETELALKDGADEIDWVMNLSAFRTNPHWVKVEFARAAKLLHAEEKLLKVILETGILSPEEQLQAAKLALEAGVDFVKTSTGFASAGASLETVKRLREYLPERVGIKASGGIRTREEAIAYVEAGAERIGTSSATKMI
ncbi:MAG: deoxyribose-phosphate aldolase [Bacteroidota bacterium]